MFTVNDQGVKWQATKGGYGDYSHHACSERQRPACSAESQDKSHTDLLSSQEWIEL